MAVPVQIRERVSFQKDIYVILKDLDEQRIRGDLCDITLKVNGRCFHAHKSVLAATSPYFRSMFTSCMKEQFCQEVDLTASLALEYPDSFKHILDYIYTGEIEINVNNAEDMLRIADFLLIEDVKDYCKQFYLQHGNVNIGNCLCLSELADQHNLPEVAFVAQRMFKSRFHDHFIKSEEMYDLPESVLQQVLENKEITKHASNVDIVTYIVCWVKYDLYARRSSLEKLLKHVPALWMNLDKINMLTFSTEHTSQSLLRDTVEAMREAHDQELDQQSAHPTSNTVKSQSPKESHPVLLAANCNSALKYAKIVIFDILSNSWYSLPHSDIVMSMIPTRLNICSWVQKGQKIYMFLSYNLPYPTDLHRIIILVMDIVKGDCTSHTFRHCYNTGECCKTSLTDDRSVPPVIVHCNDNICIIGNMEGTGQVFICDFETKTYNCFQIPGTRFISLARAVVNHDQYIYIWCRHRYGHEEYCINKDTTFVRFDTITKAFQIIPTPPGIGYGEYSDTHALDLKGDHIVVHSPGKASFILDEERNEWKKYPKSLPSFSGQKTPVQMPYHGYELYAHCADQFYILQNPAAYTTHMASLREDSHSEVALLPPPVDGISLLTLAELDASFLKSLPVCERFDDTYTQKIHTRTFPVDYDTSEESGAGLDSESEDGYEYDDLEYDDAIYGYFDDFDF